MANPAWYHLGKLEPNSNFLSSCLASSFPGPLLYADMFQRSAICLSSSFQRAPPALSNTAVVKHGILYYLSWHKLLVIQFMVSLSKL